MTPPTLTSLLARWEEGYLQGRDLPAEELCPDRPELAGSRERMAVTDSARGTGGAVGAAGMG